MTTVQILEPDAQHAAEPTTGALITAQAPITTHVGGISGVNWSRSRDIVTTIIGGAIVLYMILWILQHFTKIILIFVMAAVIAFMIGPLVTRLEKAGLTRGWATLIVYGALILFVGGGLVWVGGGLATQLAQLSDQIPSYTRQLQNDGIPFLENWLTARGVHADFRQLQADAASGLQATSTALLGRGVQIVTGITDAIVNIVLCLVISLYLVLDAQRIRDSGASLIPAHRQRLFTFVETSLTRVMGGYIRGQLIMAAIIAISSGVGCWLLGVRYPLVIGVLAFLFELIPMLGPVLAAIPAIVISVFQPLPLVFLVVAFFIVMQLIESNVLGPRITGHAVGLHPVVSILALLGGAEVAGLWGALFAVPVVGLLSVLGAAAFNELRGKSPTAVIEPRKSWRIKRSSGDVVERPVVG